MWYVEYISVKKEKNKKEPEPKVVAVKMKGSGPVWEVIRRRVDSAVDWLWKVRDRMVPEMTCEPDLQTWVDAGE